uniref:Putative secreted protein n=2 Tax=Ixodes ricinus TaxID=34613 RepID=V5IBB2_IXORI
MKAQQLATIWLSLVFCVQGQHVVSYGQRVSGSAQPFVFNQGVVRPENLIATSQYSNAPPNPRELPNLRIPAPALEIGQNFRRPDGQYGVGSIFENGRTSIPVGASVASGRSSLSDQLGLGNVFLERAAGAGLQGGYRRIVRLRKRAADESLDIPAFDKEGEELKFESTENKETLVSDAGLGATLSAPLEEPAPITKQWQYDGGYKYRLAKAAIKSNPRKGISFKIRDGEYKVGSVYDSTSLPLSLEKRQAPPTKKFLPAISSEVSSSRSKAFRGVPKRGELPTGISFKKPEGAYGIGSIFGKGTPVGFEHLHHLAKRQAVGSGKVTAVIVEFDKDAENRAPVNPPASSQFRPGFGFNVQVPPNLDERTSKLVLKNVVYRKRPGALKPAVISDPPKKARPKKFQTASRFH